MKQMIEQFAAFNLFGRENYEYYARVTGRVLRVQDEWICSFRYPPPPRVQLSLETEKTWLQCECERWGLMSKFFFSSFLYIIILNFNTYMKLYLLKFISL